MKMRNPLFVGLFLASATFAGCGGDKTKAVATADMAFVRSTLTADQAAAARAACTFTAGTAPGRYGDDEQGYTAQRGDQPDRQERVEAQGGDGLFGVHGAL